MAEKYELAEVDYKNGMKYKDIAEKYGVTLNTVKSWKTRKWGKDDEEKGVHTKTKSMHTKKGAAPKEKKVVVSEEPVKEEDDGLTEGQRLFCYYYVQSLNATSAYQKTYKCSRNTAMVEGSKCLRKPKVKAVIDELKAQQLAEAEVEALDVLLMYKKIAFADITDFIDFTQVESEATETEVEYNPDGSKKSEKTEVVPYTYTKFAMHHSEEIDGTLITELSKGKDGMFKVKLADKMAALAFLAKYTDLLNDNERKQLQEEQSRLSIDKTRAEITKIQSETKGLNIAQAKGVDLSTLTTEELRALAARNKR
ncbi:MAG: terminase small subunit [Solibacillus sp.]